MPSMTGRRSAGNSCGFISIFPPQIATAIPIRRLGGVCRERHGASRASFTWSPVLRRPEGFVVTIEFDQKGGEALVFSRQAIMSATDDILMDNGNPRSRLSRHSRGMAGKIREVSGSRSLTGTCRTAFSPATAAGKHLFLASGNEADVRQTRPERVWSTGGRPKGAVQG